MSLKYRIALTIFGLELLLMAVVLSQTISQFGKSTRQQLADAEAVLLNLLTGVGHTALLTGEYAEVQPYLDQVGADPRVHRAMLADHRGIVVASLNGRDVGSLLATTSAGEDLFWRTVPIVNPGGTLGTVAVEFSNAPLVSASSRIRRQGVAIALVGMTVIAVVGILSGALLTRRLGRVSVSAQELASGDLQARSRVDGKDEIGQLGRTFDTMAAKLEADRAELARGADALRKSEERYRSLVENAPISILEIDVEGRLTALNRAGREMMGITGDRDIVGRPYLDFVDQSDRDRVASLLENARRGQSSEFEFVAAPRGQRSRILRSGFYPVHEREGTVTKLISLAEDVTVRKEAEEALARSAEQLRQAQKMEGIGLLAGGVAHDFNNVLQIITGYCELLLLRENLADRERIQEIGKAAQRATSLTGQLLAFSRRQVLKPKVLDLNAAVADMRKMLGRVIGEDIELETVLASELAHVRADPGQIEQVILNLAINARDAMPEGGKLTLRTGNVAVGVSAVGLPAGLQSGQYVKLSLSDTGTGMTREVLDRIFEPFFTTKEVGRGTGLGLSTVYGIVKQSGGYIFASSEPGSGSTFDVYLPAVQVELDDSERAPLGPERGSGTVLLVEDDDSVRAVAREILTVSGYAVLEASDGEAALPLLEENASRVQLVITDVVMPKMGGRELAQELARRYPHVKILYTSGYPQELDRRGPDLDADLLLKPFTSESLIRKVTEALSESTGIALESPSCSPV